jgi:hypothetical protein
MYYITIAQNYATQVRFKGVKFVITKKQCCWVKRRKYSPNAKLVLTNNIAMTKDKTATRDRDGFFYGVLYLRMFIDVMRLQFQRLPEHCF